jgi:hypothetical protein
MDRYSNVGRHNLDRLAVLLTGADLVSGGKGRRGADFDAKDVKNLLIGVMAAGDKAASAPKEVVAYNALEAEAGEFKGFAGSSTFGEALESILGNHDLAVLVEKVVLCRTWPEASIIWKDAEGQLQTATYRDKDAKRFPMRHDFTVTRTAILVLDHLLNTPKPKVGWVGEDDPNGKQLNTEEACE